MVKMIDNKSLVSLLEKKLPLKDLGRTVLLLALLGSLLSSEAYAAAFTAQNLGDILQNFRNQLDPIWALLVFTTRLLGIIFFSLGVFRLKKFGQATVFMMSQASLMETLIYLFVGSVFLWSKTMVDALLQTFWGYGVDSIVGYGSVTSESDQFFEPIFVFIQVIGLVAFIRGMMTLAHLGGHQTQPGTLSKAMTFILGGIVSINIHGTMDTIKATFGIS